MTLDLAEIVQRHIPGLAEVVGRRPPLLPVPRAATHVAGLFGADLGAAKAVRALRSDLEGALANKLGVEASVAAVASVPQSPPTAQPPLVAATQVAAERAGEAAKEYGLQNLDVQV